MYADLKKAYYQCLDTIYIIAHNGYFHYYCRFVYQPNNFLKKKDSKICQIKSKYSEKKLESIKCSCVKLIFYNKLFNNISEAIFCRGTFFYGVRIYFSMEHKYIRIYNIFLQAALLVFI